MLRNYGQAHAFKLRNYGYYAQNMELTFSVM